jgi:hypothetical protein
MGDMKHKAKLAWPVMSTYSAGRHQDLGKTLYSFGKSLFILVIFLAKRSFLQICIIPGKWLIF